MAKPDRTRQSLSIEQLNAVDLLVIGKSDREVAELTGVSRQTVNGWQRKNPRFQAELNRRRNELYGESADRLRGMLAKALDVVERELDGGERPLAAALKVLEMAGFTPRTRDLSSLGIGSEDPEEIEQTIEADARQRQERRSERKLAREQERADKRMWAAFDAIQEEEEQGPEVATPRLRADEPERVA